VLCRTADADGDLGTAKATSLPIIHRSRSA
jgi:hypothetical protein